MELRLRCAELSRVGANVLRPILIAVAVAAVGQTSGPDAGRRWTPPSAGPPDSIELTGLVRDFRERTARGGHPDFEHKPNNGFQLYVGNVDPNLGPDRKPRFTGNGQGVSEQWTDGAGRNICWHVAQWYPRPADTPGVTGPKDTGGIQSVESFDIWYHDVAGINLSMPSAIKLLRLDDGTYAFDDLLDPDYRLLGGFFPIDSQLFGNSDGTPAHNYHFTFELHATFRYWAGAGQFFEFRADDDLWAFINEELVIDLGGAHWVKEQHIDLGRLDLSDGETCRLDLFYAERHREHARLRVRTNVEGLRTDPRDLAIADDD